MFTSGFNKTANLKPVSFFKGRVTPSMRPGNPIHGLNGHTGAAAQEPFAKAVGKFGQRPRQALMPKSGVRSGPVASV